MRHDHIALGLTDKTAFIEQVISPISESVGEQMIKEAVYFTESPQTKLTFRKT
jgi:hypothetical protein